MTTRRTTNASGKASNLDASIKKEIEFNAACFRFTAAITSFRTALIAADAAPSALFAIEGDITPEKARDICARWASASFVMCEALDDITQRSGELLLAVNALLAH
jgi:hypothetical protein